MKKERLIDVGVTINIDAIRAAASNAPKVVDVALEVPVVDPRDLSCEEQIFGIVLKPVDDEVKKITPDTSVYTAVLPILVETLSVKAKPGFVTVNGTIDIPKETGRTNKLEECYFANQQDAKAVCRVITEVELDRTIERFEIEEKRFKKTSDFYKNQLDNDRF